MTFKEIFISYDSELDGNLFTLKCDFGYIDFIKKHNQACPLYIFVESEYRRNGIATKMVDFLNKKYTLNWDGRFTNVGRLFFENYIKKQHERGR
jgi:GNAT superfamily N-acetyltransferase